MHEEKGLLSFGWALALFYPSILMPIFIAGIFDINPELWWLPFVLYGALFIYAAIDTKKGREKERERRKPLIVAQEMYAQSMIDYYETSKKVREIEQLRFDALTPEEQAAELEVKALDMQHERLFGKPDIVMPPEVKKIEPSPTILPFMFLAACVVGAGILS